MALPKNLLNEGEELHIDIRPHWWYFSQNAAALIVSVALLVVSEAKTDSDILRYITAGLTLVSLLWFVVRYLKWMTTNFAVSTNRVIFRQGIIAKKGIEIPLDRVNTIFFNQGIFERMIGAGDLTIESAGTSGHENFTDIRKPAAVQNTIHRLMEEEQNAHVSKTTVERDLSIPEQIDKLDDLRKRGVITDEDFAAQKTRLLEKM
jgi:uncharacterized membrane protein YdbT with pleckstrin-like domain